MKWRRRIATLIWAFCFAAIIKPLYCQGIYLCDWSPFPWVFLLSAVAAILLVVDTRRSFQQARDFFAHPAKSQDENKSGF